MVAVSEQKYKIIGPILANAKTIIDTEDLVISRPKISTAKVRYIMQLQMAMQK
jgi:hypothetical protein